jgi:hypothetical protein
MELGMKVSPQTFEEILGHISIGVSIVNSCKLCGTTDREFYRWIDSDEENMREYARAKEKSAEKFALEIVAIADDQTLDPNSRRIMVDARKWVAAKLKPKVYGDHVEQVLTIKSDSLTDFLAGVRAATLAAPPPMLTIEATNENDCSTDFRPITSDSNDK